MLLVAQISKLNLSAYPVWIVCLIVCFMTGVFHLIVIVILCVIVIVVAFAIVIVIPSGVSASLSAS